MDAVHGMGTEKVSSSPSTRHQRVISDISGQTVRGVRYVVVQEGGGIGVVKMCGRNWPVTKAHGLISFIRELFGSNCSSVRYMIDWIWRPDAFVPFSHAKKPVTRHPDVRKQVRACAI